MNSAARTKLGSSLLAFVAGGVSLFAASAASAADVTVSIDETRAVTLDRPVTTLSVGNPAIAGVTVQDGKTLFLLGRSFGRTNILALDQTGQTVADMTVFVTGAGKDAVTVFRGPEQSTYNCMPSCERSLMPGDGKSPFEDLSSQINTKTSMSEGAAKP